MSLREPTRTRQQTEFFANNQEQPPSNFGAPTNNRSNNDPIKKKNKSPPKLIVEKTVVIVALTSFSVVGVRSLQVEGIAPLQQRAEQELLRKLIVQYLLARVLILKLIVHYRWQTSQAKQTLRHKTG